MKPILIIYATREGHTRRIVEHLAQVIGARGLTAELRDARELDRRLDPAAYSAAILAASIHLGHHEKEMERFVERDREQLERLPTAFLSVSLTEAGAENTARPPESRAEAARAVAEMMDAFFAKTGWHPDRHEPVAGALMYSRYNVLIRWVLKRIAQKEGGSTDTKRDHVYTDWEALDRFVEDFIAGIEAPASPSSSAPA